MNDPAKAIQTDSLHDLLDLYDRQPEEEKYAAMKKILSNSDSKTLGYLIQLIPNHVIKEAGTFRTRLKVSSQFGNRREKYPLPLYPKWTDRFSQALDLILHNVEADKFFSITMDDTSFVSRLGFALDNLKKQGTLLFS